MTPSTPTVRWKHAIVWGASPQFGQAGVDMLLEHGISLASFVDRSPPPSGTYLGYPVLPSASFPADTASWQAADVIVFGMMSDRSDCQRIMREAGFTGEFATFHNGMTAPEFLSQRPQLFPREILHLDHGPQDTALLARLAGLLDAWPSLALHGANELTDYLFSALPGLDQRVRCVLVADPTTIAPGRYPVPVLPASAPPEELDAVWITSTSALENLDTRHFYADLARNITLLDWEMLIRQLPQAQQPKHAFRDTSYHIYPLDIPPIRFEAGLDFLLLDLPARFLGMLPNGLGYVHNILKQIDCRSQTADLDMIFYHRFHTRRLLDAEPTMLSPAGRTLPSDPWGVTVVEDFWSDPDLVAFFQDEIDQIIARLIEANPKILGISLHTTNRLVANQVIAHMRRARPEMLIVVGGYDCNNPNTSPRVIGDYDYMVIFEAENSLPPLVDALLAGKRHFHIPGVISRKQYQSPLHTPYVPAELPEDLDAVGFPKYEWSDIRMFRNHNGYQLIPITLSRGCRWSRCTFCGERFHWRRRSPGSVADEIQWFAERGGRLFHFNDSDLSGDPVAVRGVCEEIVQRGIRDINMIGQLRVQKGYTKEYFDVLRAAGFRDLRYGIDGWSKNTLKLHKKGYTLKMIEEVLGYTTEAGIGVGINLVIGIPGETEEDIDETIRNMIKNRHRIKMIENINTLLLTTASVYWTDPAKFGIVLHADKDELERQHPLIIPTDMWHSEGPYIDQAVRKARLDRIIDAALDHGITIGGYAARRSKQILEDSDFY